MKIPYRASVLLIVGLVLATSCSNAASAIAVTATPAASPTLSVTLTPVATATPATLALSQTAVEGKRQAFSLNYPKDWVADTTHGGIVMLASHQDLLKAMQSADQSFSFKSGQVVISVQMQYTGRTPAGVTRGDVIALMKAMMPPESARGDTTFGEPQAVKLGDLDAGQVDLSSAVLQGTAYAFWLDNTGKTFPYPYAVFWAIAATAPGELPDQQALIDAMIQSVQLPK